MTAEQATEWVYDQDEMQEVDHDELDAAFAALYGRLANDEDRQAGLWSLCCNATPNCGTRPPKVYDYGTDSGTGQIKAASAEEALSKLNLTAATIADGAWGWVEAADGSEVRVNVGAKYARR